MTSAQRRRWVAPGPTVFASKAAAAVEDVVVARGGMGVAGGDGSVPVGAIFDTNSKGRFDLVIYEDGRLP